MHKNHEFELFTLSIKKKVEACANIKQESLSLDDAYQLYTLGYHLYESGELEKAKLCFERLILDYPFEERFIKALASCYQMLKLFDEAAKCWMHALVLEPGCAYFAFQAGDCFVRLGKKTEAKQAFQMARGSAHEDKELLTKIELMEQKL